MSIEFDRSEIEELSGMQSSYDASSYDVSDATGCSRSSCAGMCTDEMAYSPHPDDPNSIDDAPEY